MEKCLLVDIRIKNLYLVVNVHSGKETLVYAIPSPVQSCSS